MRRLMLLVVAVVVASLAFTAVSSGESTARTPMLVYASVRSVEESDEPDDPNIVGDLFLLRPDGRGLQRITTTAWHETDPAWSPDGRRIAFSRGSPFFNAGAWQTVFPAAIFVIDGSGKNLRPVTNTLSAREWPSLIDSSPTWSPDGQLIAFAREDQMGDTRPGIYVVGADGKGLRRVATRHALSVDWSPDGASLAFVASTVESWSAGRVGLIDLQTGTVKEFRLSGALDVSWSPDGRTLAVVGERGITLMAPTGRVVRQMATGGNTSSSLPATRPGISWSPDGRQLACSAVAKGRRNSDIFIVAADGQGTKRITGSPGSDFAPDWRP